ncbi:neutral zinc metallopeptidase [Arcobacter sp. s6]|uniref:KPN_02809 family neutral zinc metallopeptidase n=1 Tax=Arcobacter sp. s6 TaxID=3230363 RepID=UPI0034A08765
MKWENNRRSSNIEDKRGESGSNFGSRQNNSLMMLLPVIKMLIGTKIGRIILIIGAIAYFMGFNPLAFLDMGMTQNNTSSSQVINTQKDDKSAQFVSAVLAQTEDIWSNVFKKYNANYIEPKLVLFRNSVKSGCGFASSQTGPFYCPADQKVYLDLSFFDELAKRHDAPGDFAQAYVIAHEIGHHVQNITGTISKVQNAKQGLSDAKENALQVKVELQADCYAGLWAYYSKKDFNSIEEGDIQEALNAASAIGDDTLQKKAQGYVRPDSFTHGSAAQRMAWFKKGFENGTLESCNTFN